MNDIFVVHLRLDYLLHGLLFLPITFFLSRWPLSGYRFPVILLAALLFALFCEAVQYPLPYRAFNINDLIANLAGVVAGTIWKIAK